MRYPVAIEWGGEKEATGIVVPDIPGAVTAGDSVEEAYQLVIEVAQIHLEDLAARGEDIPLPSTVETLRQRKEFKNWGWGFVDIDVTPYLGKTTKVNVTLPQNVIRVIDQHVEKQGLKSRSAFLASLAMEKLGAQAGGKLRRVGGSNEKAATPPATPRVAASVLTPKKRAGKPRNKKAI